VNATECLFLREVVPAAISTMKVSGVPASITVAQAILESGWGDSSLAREANNYFGIKAEHLGAPESYEEFPTAEYANGQREMVEAEFEKFPTITDCFEDHAALLATAKRYAPAMAVKSNAVEFARQLQTCGYSSNRPPLAPGPKYYSDSLIELMNEFDLTQYDAASDAK
jgi:flagellum-specific peptidoglycan hydrolase FlgJ